MSIIPQSENTNSVIYADDTVIFSFNRDFVETSLVFRKYLNIIYNWFSEWNVKTNAEKSVYVYFNLNKNFTWRPSSRNHIPNLSQFKDLDVMLDKHLFQVYI